MNQRHRIAEVDDLRGIAVLMMLVSNFIYDLYMFSLFPSPQSGFWAIFARLTAGLFILLAGLSLTLSFSRPSARRAGFGKYLKRGAMIFGCGMLVSAATYIVVPQSYVLFGVLHLIGTGIVLAYPFISRPRLSLVAAGVIFAAHFALADTVVSFPWLIWLGVLYEDFSSVDYAPLIPWFGVMLSGITLGHICLPGGRPVAVFPAGWSESRAVRGLAFLGRHSLLIYLLHQPVLFGGLYVLRFGFGVV